jgi:hypothetical protein
MNSYLEQDDAWHDFHESFIPLARELIGAQVGPGYIVKIEENIYIHERSAEERRLLGYGDVSLSKLPAPATPSSSTGVAPAPAHFWLPRVDLQRESYLEVRDKQNRRLVAVIELLSPTNKKRGEDRDQFVNKRQQLLRSQAHYVEIDMLRGWERMPFIEQGGYDYYALVSRTPDRPRGDFWPIRLREPLPVIPVPLDAPHPDAALDLQAVLHRVYDSARYANYIYAGTPNPPLTPEDDAWARQFLPASA